MLIRLADEVLNEPDLSEVIDYVKVCNGQHILCTEKNKKILTALADNAHYLSLYKKLVVKSSQAMSFVNSIEVVKADPLSTQITISDLYSLLRKPAVLVLENEHSDRKFIETILHCLGARRLIESLDDFWEIRGGGGCGEILKLVGKAIDNSVNHSRVCVVHDSDKLSPTTSLETVHTNIINACRDKNVQCKTLEKREIENYIPDEVIAELKETDISSEVKNSFYALTVAQKSFYDYKEGFRKKGPEDADYQGLFKGLSGQSIQNLANGLHKDIADEAYSAKMYPLYTQATLNRRCRKTIPEFKEIKNNIINML